MNIEPPSRTWIGCLGVAAIIIAAIIGLGVPFAERLADIYFPLPTITPFPSPNSLPEIAEQYQSPSPHPANTVSVKTQPPLNTPLTQSVITMDGPFREYQISSVGTEIFNQVYVSDGNAPYSQTELDTNHFRIYRIRPEENPDGCGVSIYNTNKVWFSSSVNTIFTVNGQEVGRLNVNTGKQGFITDWPVKVGDNICAVGYSPSGFHIIFGPDLYYHYDSYCYRGNC